MTNDILLTLDRAWRAMTVTELSTQLGSKWRTVAKEINRLYHNGLIDITGDQPVYPDDDSLRTPLWQLTSAGRQLAAEIRAAERMEEASDEDATDGP